MCKYKKDPRTLGMNHRTMVQGERGREIVPDTRRRTEDTGDTGHMKQHAGHRAKGTGHRKQHAEHRAQVMGNSMQDTGDRGQDTGHRMAYEEILKAMRKVL